MLISKWQPSLVAILKTWNHNIFKTTNLISMRLHQNVPFPKYFYAKFVFLCSFLYNLCTYMYIIFIQIFQRNLSKELKRTSTDTSNGILMPYYDHDTRVVFLAGKVSVR